MKTSKILTALVLPAMLAACTAEDIVTTNNVAQSERPLLSEDFRLISDGEGEGVNSRFYMAGSTSLSTVYEDGDKYGAALIDQYNPAYPKNPERWDVIPSLAGNTPFIYDAASEEWKAVAATGVGHYLFSFPYNINDQNRAAVSWEIPTIQELYNEDGEFDLNAAINKSNKSVAAALLKENATSHSVTMRNLFSYPKFVVKFDNGLPITTVSQVVLELANGTGETRTFTTKGGFHHEKVWDLFNPEKIEGFVGKDKAYATEDEYWASKQTADFIIGDEVYADAKKDDEGNETDPAVGYDIFTETATSPYIVAKLPENTKVKLDNDNNKYVEVRFMIPGDIIDATNGLYAESKNLKMHIYTNNGVYTVENLYKQIDFKSTTPAETRARVFARNASYSLSLKNVTEKGEELYIVTNVSDWNELVNKYGASAAYAGEDSDGNSKALKVAVVGKEFTLNSNAKMPTKAEFAVTTDITIDGTVTLKNVLVESNKVIVKKGATLNIADNSNAIKNIENYGTLNFKKAVVASRAEVIKEITGVEEVNNMPNAVLNIEKDAEATFKLNNNKEAVAETLDHGKVNVEGTLTLLGGKNYGEMVNNSYVVVAGAFVNEADYHIGTCDEDHSKCEHFTPTFTNNKSFVADGAEFTNKGNFVNAETGNVSCAGGETGKFANAASGYLKATKGGTLLITTNAGTIELDEHKQSKWSLETVGGTILYVAKSTETTLDFDGSAVTKLIVGDQNMTITKTNLLTAMEMGTGTLTLPKYAAVETGVNNTYFNGTVTLKGDVVIASELAQIKNLAIEEGSSLTINKDNKVKVDGATTNKGAVLVAGAFETANTKNDALPVVNNKIPGVFKSTQGSSNNIKFASENADLQEAYDDALENLIIAFADNKGMSDATTYNDWSDITYNSLFWNTTNGGKADWGSGRTWVISAAKALIEAYNELRAAEEGEEFEALEHSGDLNTTEALAKNKTSVEAILTAETEAGVNAAIASAKETAKSNLEAAIEAAIADKQLDADWNSEVGYAYTGVATDLNAMWTAYGDHLLKNMKEWTVTNSTTGLPEKKYAVSNVLKGSYEFAIKAEILDKVGESTSISFDIPAGAYVNASKGSDKTTATEAIYNVVKTYIQYSKVVGNVEGEKEFDKVQNWCFALNKLTDDEIENKDQYNAREAVKDYAATFIGLNYTEEYKDGNIDALKNLIELSLVSDMDDLKKALNAGVPVIELNGIITWEEDCAITKNVVIKNGTIKSADVHVDAAKVTFDGVTFDGGKNQVHVRKAARVLTIKNCTFKNFTRDAVHAGNYAEDGVKVIVNNNTFIAPATKINDGSYISLGFGYDRNDDGEVLDASIEMKNNVFDAFTNVPDAIKIYGVKDLGKVVMGGNKIATAVDDVEEGQIIISKSNDQTKDRYSKEDAYAALTATAAAALDNAKATAKASN